MKRTLAIALVASAFVSAQADNTWWDTGTHVPVLFNGAPSNLGFSSGNLGISNPALLNRWFAAPFVVPAGGVKLTGVRTAGFVPAGSLCEFVRFRIWRRGANFAQPVAADEVDLDASTGGAQVEGQLSVGLPASDEPNRPDLAGTLWWHDFTGTMSDAHKVTLDAGDYYITVYAGDSIGDGADQNLAWFTGAKGALESTTRTKYWRATTYPSPGFALFDNPANIQPYIGHDPGEQYNVRYQLVGTKPNGDPIGGDLSGDYVLEDFGGYTSGTNAAWDRLRTDNIQIIQFIQGGQVVAERFWIPNDTESYTLPIPTSLPGGDVCDIRVTFASPWLSKKFTDVNLGALNGQLTVDFSLSNGDIDGDDAVTLLDYDVFSSFFDSIADDTGTYAAPANDPFFIITGSGYAPVQADLNFDNQVGLLDYDIFSANFDEVGDSI